MSQPRDGSSPDSVVCVLGAGKVSRMCPGRGILQCRVSVHRRDTFGYEIARRRGARAGFDGRRATGRSCCSRVLPAVREELGAALVFAFGATGAEPGRGNVSVGEISVRFHAGSDLTTTAVRVVEATKRGRQSIRTMHRRKRTDSNGWARLSGPAPEARDPGSCRTGARCCVGEFGLE